MNRVIISVEGRVQGVGFRWWACDQARRLGLVGRAANRPDGTVELDVQGELDRVAAMVRLVLEVPTTTGRPGLVTSHTLRWLDPVVGASGFAAH